jgi:hypothetical protein
MSVTHQTDQRMRHKTMPKTPRKKPSADEIAEKAFRSENVSSYFTNKFTVVKPVQRVNVDLTQGTQLPKIDQA